MVLLFLSSLASLANEVEGLLSRAEELYDPGVGSFDFAAYETRLREAIDLYEQSLVLLPTDDAVNRLAVLHRLARAYFELGKAYLLTGPDQEAAYATGRDYALASLRLDPEFVAREPEGFRTALGNASRVESVFWYGTNLGVYCNYHPLDAILGGGMQDIRTCYERAAELDESFLAAAPLRSLASYLAQVPSFLGGDVVRARELFDRAIALAPEFLENSTALAQWVLKPTRDAALCPVLAGVRAQAADPVVMGAWPLYNVLALFDAERLAASCP